MTALPIDDSSERAASAHGRTTVLPASGTQPALTQRIDRTIVLVGLMGAGKTSIGRRLAARLGLPFRDADAEIELAAGCTIPELFARYGEAAFRDGERRVIRRLLAGDPMVLAYGGGAFMDPTTRAITREEAVSVWLRCTLPTLVRRVASRDNRPLLATGSLVRGDHHDPAVVVSGIVAPDRRSAWYVVATTDSVQTQSVGAVRLPGLDPRTAYDVVDRTPAGERHRAHLGEHWLDGPGVRLTGGALAEVGVGFPPLPPEAAHVLHVTASAGG